MFAETADKNARLNARRPFPQHVQARADALALFDFAYTNLKLDGSVLTPEGVHLIIQGGFVPDVSLGEHNVIEDHKQLLRAFSDMLYMGTSIDRKQLLRLFGILTRDAHPAFRSGNPILYHLDYTPPYYGDIPDLLDKLFREIFVRDYGDDCIRRAVDIHDGIIAVYPFDERTETMARVALQYELLRNGFPVVPFDLTEQAYNAMVSNGVKNGAHEVLYAQILDAVDRKNDLIMKLLDQDANA
jgi:hypothetical protein